MLCFKLNTLPVHHCHTAMNLYEIKQRCNSKAELKEAPNCVKWQCCVSNWWLKGGVIQKALQPSYTGREWHSSSLSDCGRVLLESCVGGLYRWATFWPSCHLTIANAPTLGLFVCMFVLYTSLRHCKERHETLHTHWWGPWTCSYWRATICPLGVDCQVFLFRGPRHQFDSTCLPTLVKVFATNAGCLECSQGMFLGEWLATILASVRRSLHIWNL